MRLTFVSFSLLNPFCVIHFYDIFIFENFETWIDQNFSDRTSREVKVRSLQNHFVSSLSFGDRSNLYATANIAKSSEYNESRRMHATLTMLTRAPGANSAFNQRALFARVRCNNVSFTASKPPSTMACERCINAPGHNSPANERARLSASAEWACDLMVPKHAYEILRFREFFHFRASAATPLPLRLGSPTLLVEVCEHSY
jgi:hypothetical protein